VPVLDDVGNALLAAARELLAAEGAQALTVRRIASHAGLSTMNVYSRFGGKDGVVEELFIGGFRGLGDEMAAVPETADPMSDLAHCGQAYRRFALAHPTVYSVMFDSVVPDYVPSEGAAELASATLGFLATRLQRAMDAGFLAQRPPLHAAAMVWSACHGVVSLEHRHAGPPDIDWEAVFTDVCATVMRGLAT
jgi:AcrR family transcriptional regulator